MLRREIYFFKGYEAAKPINGTSVVANSGHQLCVEHFISRDTQYRNCNNVSLSRISTQALHAVINKTNRQSNKKQKTLICVLFQNVFFPPVCSINALEHLINCGLLMLSLPVKY